MADIETCRVLKIQVFNDEPDGRLNVGENLRHIPFEVKRFYTITDLEHPRAVRGRHAHKKLEQVIFCLRGSAELFLDDGVKSKTMVLERADTGIYLAPGIWHEVRHFRGDPILLVLASAPYDESDYIRNYDEFRCQVRANAQKPSL